MSGLSAAPRLSTTDTIYLLHHVFLPPKLPQEDDYNASHESALLDGVIDALALFQEYSHGQESEVVDSVKVMLTRLRATRDCHGDVNHVELQKALEELENSGGALPVHVRCQNAAVLMTRHSDSIHVETFELSPRNEAVNTTVGRLQRQFPGPTFALDRAVFNEPNMQTTIAHALESMSRQPAPGTKPKVKKARQEHDENRDTTDPMLVTELFTSFLRPQCKIVNSLQVCKNTREEVLWLNSLQPWRRSALWLQIRVTMQLVIRRLFQRKEISADLYKEFMIFYMSSILRRCPRSISSEHRYIMTSKIVRRLRKLDLADDHAWLPFVQCSLQQANDVLEERWSSILARNACRPDMSSMARLNFQDDTNCSLPGLDEWLQSIRTRQDSSVPPDAYSQSGFLDFEPAELPSLFRLTDPDYHVYNLAAFEAWVDLNLQSWTETHISHEDTCERLSRLVNAYYSIASKLYAANPEALSAMLLTILELWIACDKSAVHIHPLLRQYKTCIPIHLFQSLLLPRQSQLTRLAHAERYMRQRHQGVQYRGSKILTDFGTPSSFSVRYFKQSAEHQRLLATIEQRAESEKADKVVELHRKHEQYRELCARRDEIECTYYDERLDNRFHFTERRHSPSCQRCRLDRAAKEITIHVHEWPLSSNPLEAESTVFELKLPRPFAFWRDLTAFIVLEILGITYASKETPRAEYRPGSYSGLSMFFTAVVDSPRIGLLSQVKPHQGTHRRKNHIINVSESDVCLANGLYFKYFDNAHRCFTDDLVQIHAMATACTYKLPPSSSSLQPFLFRPAETPDGPSPNTVIASQHTCPNDMSLGEYKALCSMPLGFHIQWQNILRQLAAPTVVFNKVETCLFTLQIMHQAGPPSLMDPILREGHHVLNEDLFAAPLLREIQKTAAAIEQNWQSAEGLSVLIALTQKVLACSPSVHIQNKCIEQLDGLRKISFGWVMTVGEEAGATDSNDHRNDLIASAAYLALMCVGTFDCENSHLERILRNDLDASVFIQCSMVIHDRKGLLKRVSSCLLPILYYRWQNIAFRGHRILVNNTIHGRRTALDRAIHRTWAAYRPGSPWTAASSGTQCCLHAQVMGESGGASGVGVYVNLLTGQLLINGRPLARLPSEFERHKTYQSLFGHSLVEVMPSDLSGLEYSAQRLHMGQTIYLGKQTIPEQSGFDLRIRAVDGRRVWEFVPPRLLAAALPDAFVEGYAHWYETNCEYIEFRPINEPWKPSPASHWRLQRTQPGNNWQLTQGNMSLISMGSETARTLCDVFQPIEKASKLHYKLHHESGMLEIEIPRLRLSFNLRSGTLIGLRNKLVLLDRKTHNRRVLIPEGQITWEQDGTHVTVKVGWQAATSVHIYLINSDIGCLTDNGTLQSKLVLCYLHAVTSFCIPDPLTKHTGTEQSLSILRSASIRSFNQLQPDSISILEKLAHLTPQRRYYPANERVMQSVQWDPILGCLAQHNEFHGQVAAILGQHHRMRIFNAASPGTEPSLPALNADLLHRDRIRSSVFRISGFGAEDHTNAEDCLYEGLGRNYQSERRSQVFTLCRILYEDIPSAEDVTLDSLVARLWKFFTKSSTVHGATSTIDATRIKYDAMWLTESGEFVSSQWCSIHRLLCSETARPNRYAVMLWLSTLAFSRKINMIVLHVLAALYIVPGMASMTLPAQGLYRLQEGSELNVAELKTRIHSARRTVTPEDGLSPGPAESYSTFHARVAKLRKTKRKKALGHFIAGLQTQWPTRCPSHPISDEEPPFADYFVPQKAMQVSKAAMSTWFDNRELRQYLDRIAAVYTAQKIQPITMPPCLCRCWERPPDRRRAFISVDDIVDGSLGPPPAVEMEPPILPPWSGSSTTPDQNLNLSSLVDSIESQAQSQFQKQYIERLRASMTSLQGIQHMDHRLPEDVVLETVIPDHFHRCHEHHEKISRAIMSRMMLSNTMTGEVHPGSHTERNILGTFANIHVWPRVSSSQLLLHQLTRKRWNHLPEPWKECLVAYGCSITALQRAKRLVNAMGHRMDLARELQNPGHTNWNPMDFPESLLLEIESGVLIRDVQEQIARRMRNAQPGQNVIMQLNMGEGKSSVIVPIVAAALADRSCLVRIIVPKPQSRQMFQMLVSKLGGLLGRRVYYLPVSRSLQIGEPEAEEIE
ncbi:similar to An08g12160 [Aspergillus luchuensis IFO 4308]|nr:similar to An08g12160 [Aspergillus luchuensis IFO 4308]